MKKKALTFVTLLIALAFLTSCVSTTAEVRQQPTAPTMQEVVTYTGPKARISVARIKCKAAKCSGAIGDGIRDMLISSLFKTNKFIVLGGREELEEIKEEIDLGQSGYVREDQAPQAGGWESADIIILGSITAFEPKASGIGGGLGGLTRGFLGGIALGKEDAYIAMDLRIVDVRTRRIINTTTVEGKASSFKIGGLGGGWGSAGFLGAGLSVYKNTPMEKAIRVMIENAVNYIATQTPPSYFRYSPSGEASPVPAPQPVGLERPKTEITGGLQRAKIGFKPGSRIIFEENFSGCTESPTTFEVVKGTVECVGFANRKWIVNSTAESIIRKRLDLRGDFAIEFDAYSTDNAPKLQITVGLSGEGPTLYLQSPYTDNNKVFFLLYPRNTEKVGETSVKKIHHIAMQHKDGKFRIFVDGRKVYSADADSLWLSANSDGISIRQLGDIDKGRYFLITNIKVSKY
ncbi:MAG: hypothetical protein GXO99_06170 [Nitrospirae bacterium]|nr:hypothetical protein [Nitrospirota bacterium]